MSLNQHDSIQGYMWFTYGVRPFPLWMFDNCRDPNSEGESRIKAPGKSSIKVLNSNEIEIELSYEFDNNNYFINLYAIDGRLLFSDVKKMSSGRNVIRLPDFQGQCTILNLLSINGQNGFSILVPLRN